MGSTQPNRFLWVGTDWVGLLRHPHPEYNHLPLLSHNNAEIFCIASIIFLVLNNNITVIQIILGLKSTCKQTGKSEYFFNQSQFSIIHSNKRGYIKLNLQYDRSASKYPVNAHRTGYA